jgi:hypothetical protein
VTRLRNQYQFDPRIQTQVDQQPYKAYPELALTDDLLSQVIAALGGQLKPEDRDPTALRKRLSAGAGADPSLVLLSVTSEDPQQVQPRHTWRDFVAYANDLYQQRSSSAFSKTRRRSQNRWRRLGNVGRLSGQKSA